MGIGGDLQREMQREISIHCLWNGSSSAWLATKKRVSCVKRRGLVGKTRRKMHKEGAGGVGGDLAKVDTKGGAMVQPVS